MLFKIVMLFSTSQDLSDFSLLHKNTLVVHWLRLQKASNAKRADVIPDQGIKIPHAA